MIIVEGLTIAPHHSAAAPVLAGFDATVARGEHVAWLGPSGSGKTTAAHALLGHCRPGLTRMAGSVRLDGDDMFDPAVARRVRGRRICYVPQDPSATLDPAYRLTRQLRRRSTGPDRIAAVLAALDLDPALTGRRPTQLSGGQAQRMALALALVADPDVVVLDEPTSGLDEALTHRLAQFVTSISAAVVTVTHDETFAAAVASRHVRFGPPPVGSPSHERATPDARPSVRVRRLVTGHGRHDVLRGVDLDLAPGHPVAVTGPSGAGKSTLAKSLAGLHPVRSGTLEVNGVDIPWPAHRRTRAQRRTVALVLQDSRGALNPHETAYAAIRRAAARDGPDADDLLARLGLSPAHGRRRPDELSGGERQRVALARAMAQRPHLLVCDEVTAALDADARQRVIAALQEVATTTAMVWISHDAAVERAASRVLQLTAGRLVDQEGTG